MLSAYRCNILSASIFIWPPPVCLSPHGLCLLVKVTVICLTSTSVHYGFISTSLITSTKTLFLNKVSFWESRGRQKFLGDYSSSTMRFLGFKSFPVPLPWKSLLTKLYACSPIFNIFSMQQSVQHKRYFRWFYFFVQPPPPRFFKDDSYTHSCAWFDLWLPL